MHACPRVPLRLSLSVPSRSLIPWLVRSRHQPGGERMKVKLAIAPSAACALKSLLQPSRSNHCDCRFGFVTNQGEAIVPGCFSGKCKNGKDNIELRVIGISR